MLSPPEMGHGGVCVASLCGGQGMPEHGTPASSLDRGLGGMWGFTRIHHTDPRPHPAAALRFCVVLLQCCVCLVVYGIGLVQHQH